VLAGAAEQVPIDPGLLQVSQTPPLQGESQQTPSTQLPVVHSDVPEQATPFPLRVRQTPDAQNSVAAH
jgi:hypothetical protein